MNQFFLNLKPIKEKEAITYNSKLVLIGSCFVENIGKKLEYCKFQNTINPFGIIFHPLAIQKLIERISKQEKFTEDDIFFYNEQWHCFEVHSNFSNSNKNEFLNTLNSTLENTRKQIIEASHIIFTYGTAWGYEKQNQVVANCHKIPQKEFTKKISSITQLEDSFSKIFANISKLNSNATIINTVSPVRHIKDGIVENNRSKANLISALHNVIDHNNSIKYFPSYELMMDCLREYRFYKSDLLHPNKTAVNFIWKHFVETWVYDLETQNTMEQVEQVQKGLTHRPFNSNSEAHQKFLKKIENQIGRIQQKYSFIKF